MRPLLVSLTTSLALVAGLGAVSGAQASAARAEVSPSMYATQMHEAINAVRVKRDRKKLRVDGCMIRFAKKAAARMAAAEDVNDIGSTQGVYSQCDLHAVVRQSAVGFENGTRTVNKTYLPGAPDLVLGKRWRLQAAAARQGESGTWYVMLIVAERT